MTRMIVAPYKGGTRDGQYREIEELDARLDVETESRQFVETYRVKFVAPNEAVLQFVRRTATELFYRALRDDSST